MKHTGSYIIAAIWILIALFLGGVLIKGLRNSDKSWNILSIGNWFNKDFAPTNTETIETSYSESAVKAVDVYLVSSSFNMSVGSGDSIIVKIMTNLPEERRPVAKLDGNTLSVKTPSLLASGFNFGLYKTSVEVIVPKSFNSSSRTFSRNINIEVVSGSVCFDNISAKSFNVESVSGSVKLIDVEADSFECDSVSGSIKADGAIRNFNIESVSGSINVSTSDMINSNSSVESISGSVHIKLPENNGFTLDYSSTSGTTHNEFTGFKSDRKSRQGKDRYKNGGENLNISTVSGSIYIEKN